MKKDYANILAQIILWILGINVIIFIIRFIIAFAKGFISRIKYHKLKKEKGVVEIDGQLYRVSIDENQEKDLFTDFMEENK